MFKSATFILIPVILLTLPPARLMADEACFNQSVPFSPGMEVKIDCRVGDIKIMANEGQSIDIRSRGFPQPSVSLNNSLLTVLVPKPAMDKPGPEIHIALPSATTLKVDLAIGDLVLEGHSGRLDAKVGVGEVRLNRLSGDIKVHTSSGNIKAVWISSESLPRVCQLSTGVGDIGIVLPPEAPVRISAEAGSGSISAPGLNAAGASRKILTGEGDRNLSLTTGIGDIRIRHGSDDASEKEYRRRPGICRYSHRRHLGGGGGFFLTWPDRSYRDFNAATSGYGYPAVEKESHAWGGEGYVQFNRFRIGGMGWRNMIRSHLSLNDTLRYSIYNYSYGGLTLEYVVLRTPRADLSFGAMLGGGGSKIRLAKAKRSDITWNEAAVLEDYREVSIDASGFAGMPMARLKVRLLGWLSFQAQAGYLYCRSNDWKYQEDRDLFNPPRLDASGWVFALGPHFGL